MAWNDSASLPFEPPEQENIRLREENARLQHLLAVHGIPIPQLALEKPAPTETVKTAPVDKDERARKRIAVFRNLFRGIEDVSAQRWESADGQSGYAPAAIMDWKAINKSRLEDRMKVDQKTRELLPVSDAASGTTSWQGNCWRVSPPAGRNVLFLASDFDKKTWEYDSQAFLETCKELSVPAAGFSIYVPDDLAGELEGAIRNGRDPLKLMTEAGRRYTLAPKNERVLRNRKQPAAPMMPGPEVASANEAEFLSWCWRLALTETTQAAIAEVRSRNPTRRVGGDRENVSGRYEDLRQRTKVTCWSALKRKCDEHGVVAPRHTSRRR